MKFHAVLVAFALIGCGKKDDKKDDKAAGTESKPASSDPAAGTPPATPPPSDEAIDVCGFAPRADVETAIGKLTKDPEPAKRQGSLLGQCTYTAGDVVAMVMARPASEYDGTVKYGKPTTAISGLGEEATHTEKAGVHVKLAGKRYFLVAFAIDGAKGVSTEKSEALAKAVVAGAK